MNCDSDACSVDHFQDKWEDFSDISSKPFTVVDSVLQEIGSGASRAQDELHHLDSTGLKVVSRVLSGASTRPSSLLGGIPLERVDVEDYVNSDDDF